MYRAAVRTAARTTLRCQRYPPTISNINSLAFCVRMFATRQLKHKDLTVGGIKETFPEEKRVAITPENVQVLLKAGFKQVLVEQGCGEAAQFSDKEYTAAGATLVDKVWCAMSPSPPPQTPILNLF